MKKHTIHLKSWLVRLILILVTIFMLYPVFWSVYSSFKTSTEFLGNPFSLPSSLEWNNYVRAVQKSNLFSNLKNSVYVVVVGPDSDSSSGGAQFLLHCEIPLFR